MFRNPIKALSDRKMMRDTEYYAAALQEVESGVRRDGLWAMAIVQSSGRDENVKPIYLRLLAEAIKQAALAEESARQRQAAMLPRSTMSQSGLATIKAGNEYYYVVNGKEIGPISGQEMKRLANRLPALTKVRTSEMDGWSDILRMSPLLDAI